MLVLTRKLGEKILLGDDIEICLLAANHDSARIGITAPKEIKVWREEIANGCQKEKAVDEGIVSRYRRGVL